MVDSTQAIPLKKAALTTDTTLPWEDGRKESRDQNGDKRLQNGQSPTGRPKAYRTATSAYRMGRALQDAGVECTINKKERKKEKEARGRFFFLLVKVRVM